jgi:hypothetical protein
MGMGGWGLGLGDWGLGIGPNPQSPIPNPQSPIPNPQSPIPNIINYLIFNIIINIKIIINFKKIKQILISIN